MSVARNVTSPGSNRGICRVLVSSRHRDFRLVRMGTFVSNAGSWMQKITTGWLVYELTGPPAWLGIEVFASGLPTVLLMPWGGVLSDRMSRRSLLIWTKTMSACLSFVLAGRQFQQMLQVRQIVLASVAQRDRASGDGPGFGSTSPFARGRSGSP